MKLIRILALGLFLILPAAPAQAQQTPGTTPIALVEEAYVAHRKGEYDKAIKAYTAIIQRRGLTKRERAISYLLRGEARRDAGKLNDAVLDFSRAIRQWPGYPQAYFFRGRVYERQGKFMEAYADLARAVELDPGREPYQTALSVLKKRMTESGLKIPASAPAPAEPKLPLEED